MTAPRVALWGAGVIAGAHAAVCSALGWPIVGIASRSPARAGELAAEVGAPAMTYADLLTRPDIDLAIISTPPADHADAAISWSERGAHVLISTPLCDSLAEADRLVDAERSAGTQIMLAANIAFAPSVQRLFREVPRLGPLTSLTARGIRPAPGWGGFLTDSWGGGVLLHPGTNHLALVLFVARLAELGSPTTVAARLSSVNGRWQRRPDPGRSDVEADVAVTFEHGDRATVRLSWTNAPTQWELQVAGTDGVVRLDLDGAPVLEVNGDVVPTPIPTGTPASVAALASVGFVAELVTLWDDIEHGRAPVLDMEFGRDVTELICAAYASASIDGAPVALPFTGPRDATPLALWNGAR